jgi:hypothetical protein
MIFPCPKPKSRKKKVSGWAPKRRTRLKPRNAKRKGSAFPKVRDKTFCVWLVTENPCLLEGGAPVEHSLPVATSIPYAIVYRDGDFRLAHRCWGAITPAHVGKHRAQGAPDFGHVIPLCKAAHQFYDEHRSEWPRVTGYSEKKMALAASGYALKYVEQGGVPVSHPPKVDHG